MQNGASCPWLLTWCLPPCLPPHQPWAASCQLTLKTEFWGPVVEVALEWQARRREGLQGMGLRALWFLLLLYRWFPLKVGSPL